MSRLECLGKSSRSSQRQSAAEVTSSHNEIPKPSGKVEKKTVPDKLRRGLPARSLPRSEEVSCQETQRSGFLSGDVLNTDEGSDKETTSVTPRFEEGAQPSAVPDDKLKMRDLNKAQPPESALTGGKTHAPAAVEPLPTHEENEEEEQTEEEDVEDEDLKAPVELIIEFLRAVMDSDFQLASKLCQMILIYEPDNPEASEFLPLIQKKLLEEQEAEQSTGEDEEEDEDDEEDNEDNDSESDEESSQSSSCSSSSCSSSSPSDDGDEEEEEEEEKSVNRHKPCPPCHVSP